MFKSLLLRIHPDKHPNDMQRATRIYQDVRPFYDACLIAPPTKKMRTSDSSSATRQVSPSKAKYPLEFNAHDKWPHMQFHSPYATAGMSADAMSCAVAYQCINARGAIAHGKIPELIFDNNNVINEPSNVRSVENVFSGSYGVKELVGVNEIKEEIMNRGPVVSTSFCPSDAFLNNHIIGKSSHCYQSDIIIIGWMQLSTGEVWILQPLYRDKSTTQPVFVGMGQFGLDDCCLAPRSNFEHMPWQSGPYYDINTAGNEDALQTWARMTTFVRSLDSVFKTFGTANLSAITVRDKAKHSKSRKAAIRRIEWNGEKQMFVIDFDFIE
jgi:hypothetical protein